MTTKTVIEFIEGGEIRKFEGNKRTINLFPGRNPAVVFDGVFNNEENCIVIVGMKWFDTKWDVEGNSDGKFVVTDPLGESRLIKGFYPAETEKIDFIVWLMTFFSSWSDFDSRAEPLCCDYFVCTFRGKLVIPQ